MLIDSLEKDRLHKNDSIEDLRLDIGDLLEFIAFRVNVNSLNALEDSVGLYLKDRGLEAGDNAERVCRYLRRRRIIAGNDLTHGIYSSYFAAKYIYRRIYERKVDYDFGEDYIGFLENGLGNLSKYAGSHFKKTERLWPDITTGFVHKLDYEIRSASNKGELEEGDPSYPAYEETIALLREKINEISLKTLLSMAKEDRILYYPKALLSLLEKR